MPQNAFCFFLFSADEKLQKYRKQRKAKLTRNYEQEKGKKMIRKIKTSRNKNKENLAGLLGGGITRPASQFESNSLFADPNLHVPGERLFGPQASLRITSMQQCDSNPRPLATFAVFVAHHVNHLATLTSVGNISINSRGG